MGTGRPENGDTEGRESRVNKALAAMSGLYGFQSATTIKPG